MTKKILLLFIIFIFIFLAFKFLSKPTPSTKHPSNNLKQENYSSQNTEEQKITAFDFTLQNINGKKTKLSDFKGKVIILNFWATWCPPCRAEIPSFIEFYKKYSQQGLVIIGVAIDNETKVKNFAKEYKINYPILLADETTIQKYGGIRGIPTTFIIDKNGYIVKSYVGYRPKEIFENDFNSLK